MNETKYVLGLLLLVLSVGYTSGSVLSSSSMLAAQQGQENVTQYNVAQEQVLQKCDEEGASKECDCNFCYCFNGHWSCSNKICFKSAPLETENELPQNSTKANEEPLETDTESQQNCAKANEDNQVDPDYDDPNYQEDPDYKECVTGTRWREECNICECSFGIALCTMKICLPECIHGSSWVDYCNTCECYHGEATCTDNKCLSDSAPHCIEGTRWTEDCNTCFCSNGITSCSKKICTSEGDETFTQLPEMTFAKENNSSGSNMIDDMISGPKFYQGLSSNDIIIPSIPSELNFCSYMIDGQQEYFAYVVDCYKRGKLACAYCEERHKIYNPATCKCHRKARARGRK